MKRFYNNTLISGAFSKALRVVALLCVLLGVSGSAWADGFFDGMKIGYYPGSGDGDIWTGYSTSQINLGELSGTPYFKGINVKTYDSSVKKVTVEIKKGNTSLATSNAENNNNNWDKEWYIAFNFALPNTSGSHTISVISTTNNGTSYTNTFTYTIAGAGGDTPSGNLPTSKGECQKIEIYSKDNVNLYAFKDGQPVSGYNWDGGTNTNPKGTSTTYNGSTYYKWTIDGYDYIQIIFRNGNLDKQSGDSPLLYGGYTYVFDGSFVSDSRPQPTPASYSAVDCSGSGSGDDDPLDECDAVEIWARGKGSYTDMICKVSSGNATSTGIKSYNGNNYATWKVSTKNDIAVNFCAGDNASYCTNAKTMSPGNRYICEFEQDNWGSQDYTIIVTQPLDCADQPTDVLLSQMPLVNKATKQATLYGYLKQTHCENIADYGFYYCRVLDGEKCKPNAESVKLQANPSPQLKRSQEFKAILDLEDGYTYYYRAYAVVGEETLLSQEIRSISTDPCVQQACCGEPIVYTIDASLPNENQCKLQFLNLQDAIDHLKESSSRKDAYAYTVYTDGSYNLQQPVVMNVVYYDDTPEDPTSAYIYRGTTDVGVYAGDNKPANANLIQDFNKSANADPANTLTIKAGTKVAKPWIHHIVIRNSKNIVLDSLCIYSDPNSVGDNALEIDVNSIGWDGLTTGQFADANILIQNCMIGSNGFTGVHVSAYDGITFKKNDFEIVFEGKTTDGNVLNWSASAKFMMCKNIKFIQNNFRGSQPTMLWLQECQNALFMNNVFWNTNTFVPAEGSKAVVPSAVRLVSQYANEIDNIGFYYNTFYFANNDINAPWGKYNFFNQYLAYTNNSGANINKYGSDIYFKYNNCYSYDKDCPGMYDVVGSATGGGADMTYTTVTATSDSENFCPNNFWSQYDQDRIDKGETVTKSAFAFGCSDNDFVNVKGQVCETTASGPASLIVKGNDLNSGVKPDVDFTNIQLTDEEKYSDRYLQAVRPQDGEGWTFGAHQSKSAIPTTTIYWVGVTDKWDDRNNWEYEVTDADGKVVRQRVSCVNQLSSNLKVVIEEIGTVEVSGGRKWPKVPASFNAADRTDESSVPEAEQVSAGLGVINTPTKYASTIELEYGAGLRGVENLNIDGTRRYDKAIVHFDADREKWLLVGTVVKPFVDENDTDGDVRNVKSGDYFKDFLPQVYMRETTIDAEGNVSWTKTFSDLDTYVTPNSVFAIDVRDKYGPNFLSAETYNAQNGTSYDGKALIPYRFAGRFAVEAEKANDNEVFAFTVQPGVKNLLNNNYPCNIDAVAIEEAGLGTINLYDYVKGSFVCTDAKGDSYTAQDSAANAIPPVAYIKAQNGFVFTPKAGLKELVISDYLVEGSTRTRSTERELPTFSLDIDNANTTAPGASNVVVRYDEEMDVTMEAPLNTPKVFTKTMDTPEAYIMHNDAYYSRLYVGNGVTRIPLGIRLRKAMNVTFQKVYNKGFSSMILLDTQTGKEYDLLTRSYTTNLLPKGDTEGRFYLVFSVIPEDEYLPDDDMTTGVDEEVETANADINIYTVNGNTIRVVTNDVNLQTIYVSDMVGRTAKYDAEGNFAEIELPVVNGVYTVQVIGDKLTRNEKVIIK